MSVTQQICWIHLKHLLLRNVYKLPLLKLCATLLADPLMLDSATELTSRTRMRTVLNCRVA